MDGNFRMVGERLARLRLAFLVGSLLGLFSVVCDLLLHSYSVAVSGCPKTITSFIDCGGRGPHLELLSVLGGLCVVGFALLVGWIAYHLIRSEREEEAEQ